MADINIIVNETPIEVGVEVSETPIVVNVTTSQGSGISLPLSAENVAIAENSKTLEETYTQEVSLNNAHRENAASADSIATKFNGSASLCKSDFTFNVIGVIDWSIDLKVGEMITANQDSTIASQLSIDTEGNGEFYVYFTNTLFYAVIRDSNDAVSYFVFARSSSYIPIAEEDVLTITIGDNGSGKALVWMYLNGVDMTTLSTASATGYSANADSSLCEGDYTIYLGSTFGVQWFYTGALYYFTLTSGGVIISDLQDIYSGVDVDGGTYTITNMYKERDITYPHPGSAVYVETLENKSIEELIGTGNILSQSYLPTANITRALSNVLSVESGAAGEYNLNGNTLNINLFDTEGATYFIGDAEIELLKGLYNGRVVISCEDSLLPTTAGSSQGIIIGLNSTGWYNLMNLNVNLEFVGIKFNITSDATRHTFFETRGSNSITTRFCCFNFSTITADSTMFNACCNKIISVDDCFIGSATYDTTFVSFESPGSLEIYNAIFETNQFTYAVTGRGSILRNSDLAFTSLVNSDTLIIATE